MKKAWWAAVLLGCLALGGCKPPSLLDLLPDGPAPSAPANTDSDADGVVDARDNCPARANPLQADLDADGAGNDCDPDQDGDGVPGAWEQQMGLNPYDATDAAQDDDGDGLSNEQEFQRGSHPHYADIDNDGILDMEDNCSSDANPDQLDLDGDNRGDACDLDVDGDGLGNDEEVYQGSDPRNAAESGFLPTLRRLSVTPGGQPANGYSMNPVISADAAYVALVSSASDLVPADDNGKLDVFLMAANGGSRQRISVNAEGQGGNADSLIPFISGDGRVVAFHSSASNLVSGDTNEQQDVFAFDRISGALARVSVASSGEQASAWPSYAVAVSRNGQSVYFNSNATNLAAGLGEYAFTLLRRDLVAATTVLLVSSVNAALSADERWLAFETPQKLLAPDTNDARDIFLRDAETGALRRISLPGPESNGDSFRPQLSGNGRWLVYESSASNLVMSDANGRRDIFLFDVDTGVTERINMAWNGEEANRDSFQASVSDDGRFVTFASDASNLVLYDYNGARDVFLYDRVLRQVRRISTRPDGTQANRASDQPRISGNGRCVVYVSSAGNLDALVDNEQRHIYLYCR